MLYLIAEQLGFPGVLNLIRYISFRAGAASATALLIGLLLGPKFISWLRETQGKGQPIRDDGPQSHLAKRGTPTMGGLLILTSVIDLGPAVDGPHQPLRLGLPDGHRGLRRDRLARRLRQGEEGASRGPLGQDAAAARIPDRGRRDLADGAYRTAPGSPAVRQGDGARPRLVLHRLRRVRDRRVRQCGEPDRRARRPRDHAGDHRRHRLPPHRLSRRQREVRDLSRHPARARRRRPHRAAAGDRRRGPRLPVVQRAARGGLHGRHRQPRARRGARRDRGRDAPRVRAGDRRRPVRGRGAVGRHPGRRSTSAPASASS